MIIPNRFEPWSLPRNTTYFSTPLDLHLNSSFKKIQTKLTSDVAAAAIRVDAQYKPLLLAIATEALKMSFSTACIVRSVKESYI